MAVPIRDADYARVQPFLQTLEGMLTKAIEQNRKHRLQPGIATLQKVKVLAWEAKSNRETERNFLGFMKDKFPHLGWLQRSYLQDSYEQQYLTEVLESIDLMTRELDKVQQPPVSKERALIKDVATANEEVARNCIALLTPHLNIAFQTDSYDYNEDRAREVDEMPPMS